MPTKALYPLINGLIFIIVTNIVLIVSAILLALTLIHIFPQFYNGYNTPTHDPNSLFNLILNLLRYSSLITGGVIVGYGIRKNGWIWGGVLGMLTAALLLYLVTVLEYILGGEFVLPSNIFEHILNIPIIIALTIVGGFLGEKYSQGKSFKKAK